MTLAIDTRGDEPRQVSGDLDDPTPAPAAGGDRRRRRRPRVSTPIETTTASHQPNPPSAPDPDVSATATGEGLDVETSSETTGACEELATVRRSLLELVPPLAAGEPTLGLVRILGAKLEGHANCAALINPGPGASIDEIRGRCSSLLLDMGEVERNVVLALLTADVEGASR